MTKVFLIQKIQLGSHGFNAYWLYSDKHIEYTSGPEGESVKLGRWSWGDISFATQFSEEEANEFLEAITSLSPDLKGNAYLKVEDYLIS